MSAALQADFAAALLDGARPAPAGLRAWNGSDPARRFDVHRNNVVVSLVEALADTFPVVRRLVGAAFFAAMAGRYVREHPPASPVLAQHGDGFADWLAGHAPVQALPYLPDMARLEHARVLACHAADALPLAHSQIAARLADPAGLPGSMAVLHPSCRVLWSRYAIHALWAAHQRDDDDWAPLDIDHPGATLVLRDPADDVQAIALETDDAAFVQALLDASTLGNALRRAPGVDLPGALALLLRHGAIVGWRNDESSA